MSNTLFGRTRSARTPKTAADRAHLRLDALDSRDVPATFWVTSPNDSGPGTLRAAVQANNSPPNINTPNEIVIAAYLDNIGLFSSLSIYNSAQVVIHSENPADPVTIKPAFPFQYNTFRFLLAGEGNSGNYVLTTLRVQHFGASDDGGAIQHWGNSLSIINCDISYNTSGMNGGAVANLGFQLYVEGGGFTNNIAAGDGGAIFHAPNGGTQDIEIHDSFFGYNQAGGNGGAIAAFTLKDVILKGENTLAQNAAGGRGGGLYHEGGNLIVLGGEIYNNASVGGGSGICSVAAFSIEIDSHVHHNYYPTDPKAVQEPNVLIVGCSGPIYIGLDVESYTII
jgi:hypothetical protein